MGKKKQFFIDIKNSIISADLSASGAQITYFLIFSIFPFMITLLNLAKFLPLSEDYILNHMDKFLPTAVSRILIDIIQDILDGSSDFLFFFSIFIGIWSASKGVHSIIKSINNAYSIKETRGFIHLKILSIFFTIFLLFSIVMTLIGFVFAHQINLFLINYFNIPASIIKILNVSRYILIVCMLILVFALLYRFSPNHAKDHNIKFIHSLPGAIFTTVVWLLISQVFSFYVNNFSNYAKTYGSIGGIIVLMLWLNISSIIILLGGILNACLQRQFFLKEMP